MEALEEVVGGSDKDLFHIVKGKRTKRVRLQSPSIYDNTTFPDSPTKMFINSFTDEEEETARCLILMSKGTHHHNLPRFTDKVDFYKDDLRLYQTTKFNSKKYIETNSGNGAKAGMYVYECKTCNRTFPSFQALGGHRASHKKPKILTSELDYNKSLYLEFSDEDDEPSPSTFYKNNKINKTHKSSNSRIHECSYCGAEFTSGQALGGHMRRHRGGVPLHFTNSSPATSIEPDNIDFQNPQESASVIMNKQSDGMPLDLNLPVPHDNEEQTQHKDPAAIGISTSQTMVDCHY